MCIHVWNFPEKNFSAFSLLLTNQSIFSRHFAFLISTNSHTPTNTEKKQNKQKFIGRKFFMDIQKMTFSRKFQKLTKCLLLNEKCVFSYCKTSWPNTSHRFKSNVNFEMSSIVWSRTTSVFWAQSWTHCKKPIATKICWMKWWRKSWTMVKPYSKFRRNQTSHFGAKPTIK